MAQITALLSGGRWLGLAHRQLAFSRSSSGRRAAAVMLAFGWRGSGKGRSGGQARGIRGRTEADSWTDCWD